MTHHLQVTPSAHHKFAYVFELDLTLHCFDNTVGLYMLSDQCCLMEMFCMCVINMVATKLHGYGAPGIRLVWLRN